MRYIYIAGLEHSGTTLPSELLAQRPQVLSLGEVGNYFSPQHMRSYLDKWGSYADARVCSCGEPWEKCEFWSGLVHLSGERSDAPLSVKYAELLQYVRARLPDVQVVVDSSKNTQALKSILSFDGRADMDIEIVLAAKDVRAFAASISRKTSKRSLMGALRTTNWWHGANKEILALGRQSNRDLRVVLYENVCADPERVVDALVGAGTPGAASAGMRVMESPGSHIVMGNKDFLNRTRGHVRYDSAWYTDDTLGLAYLMNIKARRLNHWPHDNAI